MKTFKNIYPNIYTFGNLYRAFNRAKRGKRSNPNVAAFEMNVGEELLRLQNELVKETYQPGKYRHFQISAWECTRRVAYNSLLIMETALAAKKAFHTEVCENTDRWNESFMITRG